MFQRKNLLGGVGEVGFRGSSGTRHLIWRGTESCKGAEICEFQKVSKVQKSWIFEGFNTVQRKGLIGGVS
jgi:hypothetical protein